MRRWPLVWLALVLAVAAGASATETESWVVDSAADLLAGQGENVAVTEDGRLVPAPGWRQAATFDEALLMAGDVGPDGSLVVGTGSPARLYRVAGGKPELLVELPAQQVTAVLAGPGGEVLAATMAPGAVFRWSKGKLEKVAALNEGTVWDLARVDGQVVAAAGPPATLYRLTGKGLERWLELPDTHARCLAPSPQGLLVGTSGKGLILRVTKAGQLALVADSKFTEIADLLAAPDGSVWAAAVVGEPEVGKPKAGKDADSGAAKTDLGSLDLPKVKGRTATSELLRLTPEGALLSVHRFAPQVATALAWDGEGVLVGTGYEGQVWRFVNAGGARLATVDAVQVVAIAGGGRFLLCQGSPQALERASGGTATFRSEAENLPRPVRWGRYAVAPAGVGTRIRFRSGVSDTPDETWLPWSDWLPTDTGTVPLPAGSSLQWEVELPAGSPAAAVERVEVAYRELNLAPEVKSLEVAEPGAVYLQGPLPADTIVDVSHPDLNGIFTVLDNDQDRSPKPGKGKKYWRVGYRTVGWEAEDPNGDPLRFTLTLERRDGFVLPVQKDLEKVQLAVDVTAVPDGRYRFQLVATDASANPADPRTATARSEWFVVDNTPPVISLKRAGDTWHVAVTDNLTPLEKAEWSRDGAEWHALAPVDGMLDDLSEQFEFAAEPGRHLIVVRAVDRQHNRSTAGSVEE